jgi:hypothetical protein
MDTDNVEDIAQAIKNALIYVDYIPQADLLAAARAAIAVMDAKPTETPPATVPSAGHPYLARF